MRVSEMHERIEAALARLRESAHGARATVYLPEIIRSFEAMLDNLDALQERRARMAGAVGRLVTEDYAFSENPLGEEVLGIFDDFASF
jgi:hypothetical protein